LLRHPCGYLSGVIDLDAATDQSGRGAPIVTPNTNDSSVAEQAIDTVAFSELHDLAEARRGRWVRRTTIAVMAAFVAMGLLNLLGLRMETASVTVDDLTVQVRYPAVTRGGLPTPWSMTIERRDGSPLGDVKVRTTAGFFEQFDRNDLVPAPDRIEQDAVWTTWLFEDVISSQLVVRLDMRTQPDARWRHATVTHVAAGATQLDLGYTTWVLP
jgi:hypothetical protein